MDEAPTSLARHQPLLIELYLMLDLKIEDTRVFVIFLGTIVCKFLLPTGRVPKPNGLVFPFDCTSLELTPNVRVNFKWIT